MHDPHAAAFALPQWYRPPSRRSVATAALLFALPLVGQAPCGLPHLVALPHPAGSETTTLADVAQFGTNDIWAVGASQHTVQGQLNYLPMTLHWDGTHFVEVPAPSVGVPGNPGRTVCRLGAVAGVAGNDVWAAGSAEQQHPLNGTIGLQVFLLHWNGTAWSQVAAPVTNPGANGAWIDKILAFASNDVWFFGYTTKHDPFPDRGPLTMHWDGSSVTVVDVTVMPGSGSSANRSWVDVDAVSPTEFWGVANIWPFPGNFVPYVGRWNGSTWTQSAPLPTIANTYYDLFAVAAIASNDVWVTGSEDPIGSIGPITPYAVHWDGSTWTRRPTSGYARSLVALASDDVWAFGTKIEHWNGTGWSVVMDYGATLANAQSQAAVAVGPCEMWSVGSSWTAASGPPTLALAVRVGGDQAGSASVRLPCTVPVSAHSLLPLATPRIGQVVRVVVDDPMGVRGITGPQLTIWMIGFGPGPLAPCGVVAPGIGLLGASIEVLIDLAATLITASVWNGPGQPAEHAFFIPNDPTALGLSLSTQGVFLTADGFDATSAIDLVIGQ